MITRLIAIWLVVALAAGRAAGQADPPNPVDAIKKVIKAYAAYQSDTSDTEIDVDGSTDWYGRYFVQYSALKLDYNMSPPDVSSSVRDAKGVRLSTLMCPYVSGLSYSCQLDAAVIRGSASTTTHSSQWNVGGTTKNTWMFGVEFLGSGGKAGVTAQFSFAWTRNTGTVDATTDQSTNTGTQALTIDPAQASCYELTSNMAKATQRGRTKLMAVYSQWVGFHNAGCTTWKDDGEAHYFRLRNIWTIIKDAQAAGIPGASDYELGYDYEKQDWYVTYANTFDTDFFLGSEGRGTSKLYANDSSECTQMLPGGWDTWMPPVNPSGSPDTGLAKTQAGGRRLAGHLTARLVPGTLRVVDEHGQEVAQHAAASARRSLQGAEPAGSVDPARARKCPPLVRHHSEHNNLTRLASPTCHGAGFTGFQKRLAAARRAAAQRSRHCALTAKLAPGKAPTNGSVNISQELAKRNHTLVVHRRNQRCRFQATPAAALDARDAAKRQAAANKPRVGEPGDFYSKLVKLVQAVCYGETQVNCEVDYAGTSDWYKNYFSAYAPVNGVVGSDDIKMAATTDFSATSSSWYCQYINAPSTCQTASTDMTSKAHTDSTTTSWNFQFKLGFKLKAQASFLGIGPSAEFETENSVDWGYSFSDGTSTTTTDGASTTASARLPLTGSMNKCAKIDIITRKASAKGSTRAWVCADGWVGTHQDSAAHWPDIDADGGETHFYRAFTLAYIVDLAQRKNLNSGDALDWYIDGQGRACLYNAVDMSFQQGVMSYVRPRLFDKDSADCNPGALGIKEAALMPASRRGQAASNFTYDAIPIPGQQDVPCDWETCGLA